MHMMMKSILIAAMAAPVAMVVAANDKTIVNAVAIQPAPMVTVKQALTMKDDQIVQLKGYIVKAVGDEKYQFRDQTGTMIAEIDNELWKGKAISAKTPITIIGEVDVDYKPMKKVSIDVDQVHF